MNQKLLFLPLAGRERNVTAIFYNLHAIISQEIGRTFNIS